LEEGGGEETESADELVAYVKLSGLGCVKPEIGGSVDGYDKERQRKDYFHF
jgi:hypothetical protein